MSQNTKSRETGRPSKPAAPKKPESELSEQELQKISGGACAGGQHIPKVKIIT